jgi:hypothetical protein
LDYPYFAPPIQEAFKKLVNVTKELNISFPAPEVVFVGPTQSGKTSALEAILGAMFTDVNKGTSTKRPFFFKVTNKEEAKSPLFILKKDNGKENDQVIDIKQMSAEIAKRNARATGPTQIQIEMKDLWNVTIIDTPGLIFNPDQSKVNLAEEIEGKVIELAKSHNRTIICIEEAKEWSKIKAFDMVQKLDPRLERTLFVYTNFETFRKSFTDANEFVKALRAIIDGTHGRAYFLSLLDVKDRGMHLDPSKYRDKLHNLYLSDTDALETELKSDRSLEQHIGIHNFRRALLNTTWKYYREVIATSQNKLRHLKQKYEEEISEWDSLLQDLQVDRLKSMALTHAATLNNSIEKILTGSIEANPLQSGQTLSEEVQEAGEWLDEESKKLDVDYNAMQLPHKNVRVYGAQQFERLLAEFKAVVELQTLNTTSMDDYASSAGPNKLNNVSGHAWTACETARTNAHKLLYPLIDQLFARCAYILKRSCDLAVRHHQDKTRGLNITHFPRYFTQMRDVCTTFINELVTQCKESCSEEFFSTRAVYWENFSYPNKKEVSPTEDPKSIAALANEVFRGIKTKFVHNVSLKCHNTLLVAVQTKVGLELQNALSTLDNKKIEELFDAENNNQKFKFEKRFAEQHMDSLKKHEATFRDAVQSFSSIVNK